MSEIIQCNKCDILFERISTRNMCRTCNREYNSKNKEKIKTYNKNRYENNKVEILNKIKIYHQNNKESIKLYAKKWFVDNKHKVNEYNRNKYQNDIIFKIKLTLRNYLNQKIKSHKKDDSSLILLGCPVNEFKEYFQSLFLPEMTWENHGEIWEIDHILPCSSFNLMNPNEQRLCFHFSNLQPLFKTTEIAESFGYTDQIGNRNKSKKLL